MTTPVHPRDIERMRRAVRVHEPGVGVRGVREGARAVPVGRVVDGPGVALEDYPGEATETDYTARARKGK